MTAERLIRFAGAGLVASGVLVTIGFSTHPHDASDPNLALWVASHVLIMSGFASGLLGLVGLYAVVAPATGAMGLIGFLFAEASVILYIGKIYWSGFIYPLVASQEPGFIAAFGFEPGAQPVDPLVKAVFYLGPVLFGGGYGLLGWAVVRSGVLPRPPALLVVAGALLVGLWPLLPDHVQHFSVFVSLVFTIGIAWIGTLLVKGVYPGSPVLPAGDAWSVRKTGRSGG